MLIACPPSRLEILERSQGTGRVLKQHLIDGERDLFAGRQAPAHEVRAQELGRKVVGHAHVLSTPARALPA
jgi:hypothetical protein